jgi:hypothetical protein
MSVCVGKRMWNINDDVAGGAEAPQHPCSKCHLSLAKNQSHLILHVSSLCLRRDPTSIRACYDRKLWHLKLTLTMDEREWSTTWTRPAPRKQDTDLTNQPSITSIRILSFRSHGVTWARKHPWMLSDSTDTQTDELAMNLHALCQCQPPLEG